MLYGDVVILDLCVHNIYIRSYLESAKEVAEPISPISCSSANNGVGSTSSAFSEAEWYSSSPHHLLFLIALGGTSWSGLKS